MTTALLLHKRSGKRVLIVNGCLLDEPTVDAHYNESFDELVALLNPAAVLDKTSSDERIALHKEGKSEAEIVALQAKRKAEIVALQAKREAKAAKV